MSDCIQIDGDSALKNIRIVLKAGLPLRETGFSRITSYPKHRCDIVAEGIVQERGQREYDYDNRKRHNSCLFQYTFSGEGRFQSLPGGKTTRLTPGMGFLVPFPSPTRYWLAPGTEWEFCYIIIAGDMAYDLVNLLVRMHGYLWELPATHLAIDLIKGLHRQVLAERIPDEFELAAQAHRFLMELFRAHRMPKPRVSPAVDRVLKLVERDYRDPGLSLEQISREAGYSRHHFSRMFRREVGISPHAHLQQFRLQRALNQITTTELPIKQIALESGYRDYAYFCKEFKRWTHKTPLTARRFGDLLNLSTIHTE
ncbi:MAG: AraC family transcriptional regulator [bacterium]|jgi:AraC-like DNA-binding protein